MSKYLYVTNTLTNNEIDVPSLQTSMGIQRQVGVLHKLPAMSLQCEGGEMRSKDQNSAYLREWRRKNPEYIKDYREQHKEEARLRRHEPRTKLIDELGGKCVICGFSDIRALQLDHINGGGTQEIKAVKYNTVKLYRFYLANLDLARKRLQVLCCNCNWIKRNENKEYG